MNHLMFNSQPTNTALNGTESLNQDLATSSQIMISLPSTQDPMAPSLGLSGVFGEIPFTPMISDPDLTRPRIPGMAKGRIVRMASDFDEPVR